MMVTSEFVGRPRRWATGTERPKNPFSTQPGIRRSTATATRSLRGQPDPRGQPGNDLRGCRREVRSVGRCRTSQVTEASVRVILGQIMAVSTLPAHYVGVFTDNPASADALRAAEASFTARAEARQATFGRGWEQVGRLMVAAPTASIRRPCASTSNGQTRQHDRWLKQADAVVKCSTRLAYCRPATRSRSWATPTPRSPTSAPLVASRHSTPRASRLEVTQHDRPISSRDSGSGRRGRATCPRDMGSFRGWQHRPRHRQWLSIASVLNRANATAVSLADAGVAAQIEAAIGTPTSVAGVAPVDDSGRLINAVTTVLARRERRTAGATSRLAVVWSRSTPHSRPGPMPCRRKPLVEGWAHFRRRPVPTVPLVVTATAECGREPPVPTPSRLQLPAAGGAGSARQVNSQDKE